MTQASTLPSASRLWFDEVVAADGPTFTAAWTCAWSDVRRRWLSWVMLGLLAGVTVGLACAGFAGARRTSRVLSNYAVASDVPDAAVLANDPDYDEDVRADVARLPEVERTTPFMVPVLLRVTSPVGMDVPLLPVDTARPLVGDPIVEGRLPDPARADEIVINEVVRDRFDLAIGDTVTVVQPAVDVEGDLPYPAPEGASEPLAARLRVVGISNAVSGEADWTPSPGFHERYQAQLAGPINEMVYLHGGANDLPAFREGVEAIVGHPVNIENTEDLFGIRAMRKISDVEQGALVLFAIAVLVGGGVLVGQALVRAVTAGAADLPTWRALGFDRRMAGTTVAAPAIIVAAVGALTVVGFAIAVSPRFPVAFSRRFELDTGLHADWVVLGAGVALLLIAVIGAAWVTAWLTVRLGDRSARRPSALARWASTLSVPAPMIVGTRLAVEPGRGKRAVPVRSALVGAVAGVLGVVGCLTIGHGLRATVDDPARAGVTWDVAAGADGGPLPPDVVDAIVADDDVTDAVSAVWARAVEVDGRSVPTFGTTRLEGDIDFVVLEGRAPVAADEVAMAPVTMDGLGLRVGDEIGVGPGSTAPVRVVGRVLLPATSHTEYDQGAWMTEAGLERVLPPGFDRGSDFGEGYVLMRWREGIDATEQHERLTAMGVEYVQSPELPAAVEGLSNILTLPVVLAVFFALVAVATVAHALVTTVRRRKHDLAVLRSMGLTRRDSRLAIMWQATLLAIVGLVIGVPVGIVVGRFVWRLIADRFPVVYVPPLALAAVLLVIPIALVIANVLAAGPARSATRIHPAEVLRSE
jgi:hypothetical protein